MSIECFYLGKRYGQKIALQDGSLEISDHKVTGLVGPNGAGKSTLLKLITGLITPSEGFVRIDNFDVHSDHQRAMRNLGAIVEWPGFYPDLSARHNLAILSGGHGKKYEQKLASVVDFLGIADVMDKKVRIFSTGMKQRLGIALALLPDSKYIILDEPANGLDPAGIVEIRQLLREYNRQYGTTVIVSSHLLGEIEMICDDLIMIVDGKLRAAGNLQELLNNRCVVRLQCSRPDKAAEFLQKMFESNQHWISSTPEFRDGSIYFQVPGEPDLPEACGEIFRAGFAISHFGREQQNLESFFMDQTTGEKL